MLPIDLEFRDRRNMLEKMKKKWWLIAIVIVCGVWMNNEGIINKSAEKILTSQDMWQVTIASHYTGKLEDGDVAYVKFTNNTVFGSPNKEDVQNMSETVIDEQEKISFVGKNTVRMYPKNSTSGESMRLQFAELDKNNLRGKIMMEQQGQEEALDVVFKPV